MIDNDLIWQDVKERGKTLSKKSQQRIGVERRYGNIPEVTGFMIDALADLNPDGLDRVSEILLQEGRGEGMDEIEMLQAASWLGSKWYSCGFPTFRLSPGLAHGLMGTRVPDYDVESPFPAYRIIFPEEVQPQCDGGAPSRGAEPSNCASLIFCDCGYTFALTKHITTTAYNVVNGYPPPPEFEKIIAEQKPTYPIILLDARMRVKGVESQGFRCLSMAKESFDEGGFKDDSDFSDHSTSEATKTIYSMESMNGMISIIKNLNAYLAMRPEDWPIRPRLPKKKRKPGRARRDEMTWAIGKEIELPEHLIRQQPGYKGGAQRVGRKLSKKVYVPGHFRRQAVGKGWKDHKTIWIQPHLKGPKDGDIAEKRYHAKTLEEAGLTDA